MREEGEREGGREGGRGGWVAPRWPIPRNESNKCKGQNDTGLFWQNRKDGCERR